MGHVSMVSMAVNHADVLAVARIFCTGRPPHTGQRTAMQSQPNMTAEAAITPTVQTTFAESAMNKATNATMTSTAVKTENTRSFHVWRVSRNQVPTAASDQFLSREAPRHSIDGTNWLRKVPNRVDAVASGSEPYAIPILSPGPVRAVRDLAHSDGDPVREVYGR